MRRDSFTQQLDLGHELIIDNFAGGGGTSEGLEQAFGRPVDIAINHNPEALAMHAINHPKTLHLCESVWNVHPLKVTHNRPVGLVWLSPDCKHFSKAKGGTPVDKSIRGLAWVGLRWAAMSKPRILMLENVEEFQDWGPLIRVERDGEMVWMPDPAKRGKTFESFVRQLRGLGYEVDWRELRACDNGAPTIRKRLFLVARRDGLPIRFPEQSHAVPTDRRVLAGKLQPYRTAAECINWSIEGTSIFGRKRPLATNTQRRVAKGLWRHVLTSAAPYIVTNTSGHSGTGIDAPLPTITTGGHHMLAQPMLTPFLTEHANSSTQRTMAANEPLRTVCAQVKGGHFSMVAPTLTPLRGTSEAHLGAHRIDRPMSTVSAGGTHHALTGAHLITIGYGERPGQDARTQSVQAPVNTITAGGVKQGLVAAHLVDMGHGEGQCGTKRFSHGVRSLDAPLNTITASGATAGLAVAFMEQANGGFYEGDGRRMDEPISTITAAGSNQRLVTAYCIKYYSSGGQDQPVGVPMHTLPTKGRMGLVQVTKVPADGLTDDQLGRARQCAELMREHLAEQFTEHADIVLMQYQGQLWVLVDITLRMLKPRELFLAQGFPESYVIHEIPDPEKLFKDGVQAADPLKIPRIPLTATAQVRMCGNSVSPYQARALALANFAHESLIYNTQAA